MTDQHVRREADQFPKDEQHYEVVRKHDAEHGEHEHRERGEVTRFAGIVAHVAERINVNQKSHAGHHKEHRFAQSIEDQTQTNVEDAADVDPTKIGRGNVWGSKNETAANETSENGCD